MYVNVSSHHFTSLQTTIIYVVKLITVILFHVQISHFTPPLCSLPSRLISCIPLFADFRSFGVRSLTKIS